MASHRVRVPNEDKSTFSEEDFRVLKTLELTATRVVDGLLSGNHRSNARGGTAEFSEHRSYQPGDDIRLLDWRAYGKTDKYYVKIFDEDTELSVVTVLDASASMAFGMSTVSKFDFARRACACITRLILNQRDSVGLAVCRPTDVEIVQPASRATHFEQVLRVLARSAPSAGGTPLAAAVDSLVKSLRRRSVILVFSDAFVDLEGLRNSLRGLRARGHEAVLFHTLAPEETGFSFSGPVRFDDLESPGEHIDLSSEAFRDIYLERLTAFLGQVERVCRDSACDYILAPTDQPPGDLLASYLRRRTASARGGRLHRT